MSQAVLRSAVPDTGTPGRPNNDPFAATERRRTPLSVVPAGGTKRRIPFAIFSFVALVAALIAVLVLNISVSSTQYELVTLRDAQISLSQENQALTQQVENFEAPQNLAREAMELGMVASPGFGSIDVDSLKVTGNPEAAKEGSEPLALVSAPEVGVATESNEAQAADVADGTAGDPQGSVDQ